MTNKKTIKGELSVSLAGDGFLRTDKEDIFIPQKHLNGAIHGDEIEISILHKSFGRLKEGRVRKILNRKNKLLTGTVKVTPNKVLIIPDNPRFPKNIYIENYTDQEHMKVLVKLIKYNSHDNSFKAELKKVLGLSGNYKVETEAILLSNGFESTFPDQVEKYAARLTSKIKDKNREDLQNITTFTIDPDDAKDFDDAISIKELSSGYEIGVHIADVTHFVKFNDPVDKEAQKRGTSVYMVGKTIPMLPEILSNDLCSLKPNETRLAFSVIFTFDKNLNKTGVRFAKTKIKSDKRFTYKEAQIELDSNTGQFSDKLEILRQISKKERESRVKNGALEFESTELEFELDKEGKPVSIKKKERLETMKIIEDLMLLANKEVAEYMNKKNPDLFIYRIHDLPDPKKLAELTVFLRAVGFDLKTNNGEVDLKDLSKMLSNVDEMIKPTVEQATLRAMAKAVYSYKNIGHFSLGFENYTHFTSPIRRYPDIMVHRLLYATLNGEILSKKELEAYRELAKQSSMREIDATYAERESIKIKQLEYMKEKVGDIFDGIVTGMIKNGIFVAEEQTMTEGLVLARLLPNYSFNEDKYYFQDDNGNKIHIGDKVKIKLLDIDMDTKRADWAILDV